jgi:hypothetical protein
MFLEAEHACWIVHQDIGVEYEQLADLAGFGALGATGVH